MSNQSSDTVFDALGEPVRRRILELLREGPTPVGQLAEHLPVGRPAVSKHLRVLEGAGLIKHRGVGTRNLYSLAPGGMGVAQHWLVKTWDTVLAAYAAEVGRAGPRTEHEQGVPVRRIRSGR
jgi:DNA-binding transcriptional ArsR family regulator